MLITKTDYCFKLSNVRDTATNMRSPYNSDPRFVYLLTFAYCLETKSDTSGLKEECKRQSFQQTLVCSREGRAVQNRNEYSLVCDTSIRVIDSLCCLFLGRAKDSVDREKESWPLRTFVKLKYVSLKQRRVSKVSTISATETILSKRVIEFLLISNTMNFK
ncbi:hypothetical protein BY458DRAFT_494330 [Sporodiniella umbellata]|nr:hypothetical protein BY458DRAFT_494330 [Sporodiniella umbellata]